ncbi:MAG: TetR/AcrR family transcriptional regulator [Deltaproteobacteria bacterium]|nr:TetR/AcrR family transcriptional regulator [Deltaproteobacteria bacterium]
MVANELLVGECKVVNAVKKEESRPRMTRQERRVFKTRNKLLSASSRLFADKGIDLTTIDDITERADLGKGTFYYHFNSKEEVITELISSVCEGLVSSIEKKTEGVTDLPELLDGIIVAHIEFFSNRWDDYVLYFQGRADLKLKEGYSGIEEPFLNYLAAIEKQLDSVIKYNLPKPLLSRIACAVAGFVSGYYSFSVIASTGEDVDRTLHSLRGALVASLCRFIKEALPSSEPK